MGKEEGLLACVAGGIVFARVVLAAKPICARSLFARVVLAAKPPFWRQSREKRAPKAREDERRRVYLLLFVFLGDRSRLMAFLKVTVNVADGTLSDF